MVDMSERDASQLELADDEDNVRIVSAESSVRWRSHSRGRLTAQVLISSVDSFQGMESDIVLLSTVRNIGSSKGSSIGFLRVRRRHPRRAC